MCLPPRPISLLILKFLHLFPVSKPKFNGFYLFKFLIIATIWWKSTVWQRVIYLETKSSRYDTSLNELLNGWYDNEKLRWKSPKSFKRTIRPKYALNYCVFLFRVTEAYLIDYHESEIHPKQVTNPLQGTSTIHSHTQGQLKYMPERKPECP